MSPNSDWYDWYEWHAPYDDPASGLSRRLSWVQDRIRVALDEAPPGPVRLISLCAGQGRDVLGVLAVHRRRGDVTARLVELDSRNTAVAERLRAEAGLNGVEIVTGDAGPASAYADLAPANVVVACGMFGNMTDAGIERMIGYCTQLCETGGTVVWTRGRSVRRAPDLVPQVCTWFEERGFDRVRVSDPEYGQCVGAHRFTGTPVPLDADATIFTFTGYEQEAGQSRS
ncbi:MAG: class I SAM-dependent methyltransferase [Trebonia sp.]